MTTDLETAIDVKVKPLVDKAIQENLGITVNEITSDISDRLLKTPLADMIIDFKLPYRKAKDNFRKWFLVKMLQLNCGNISEVARKWDVDRRSVHRMVQKYHIDIHKLREEMIKRNYVKQTAISSMIETTLKQYETSLNPKKMQGLYKNVPALSQQILDALPEENMTLKDAEKEFERKYFERVLEDHKGNVSKTAKTIGLRQETLYRKLKHLHLDLF